MQAMDIIKSCLSENEIELPIPIEKIAQQYNINIIYIDFLEEPNNANLIEQQIVYGSRDFRYTAISKLQIRRQIVNNPNHFSGTIYVQRDLDENSKRFAIAYEVSRFVMYDKTSIWFPYELTPYLGIYDFMSQDDLLAEKFARALLLPYEIICTEKNKYQGFSGNLPIDYSDWVVYLRDLAQIPEYQVVLAYNEIREIKAKKLIKGCD